MHYGILYLSALTEWKHVILNTRKESVLPTLYRSLKFNPNYLCSLGDYYYNQNKFNEAILYYKRARTFSSSKEIVYALGESYQKLGRVQAAEQEYMFVENSLPQLIKPKYLLAKLYFDSNQYRKFCNKIADVKSLVPKVSSVEVELMKKELIDLEESLAK